MKFMLNIVVALALPLSVWSCQKSDALTILIKDAKEIQKKTVEQETQERQDAAFNRLGSFKTYEEYQKYVAEVSNQD